MNGIWRAVKEVANGRFRLDANVQLSYCWKYDQQLVSTDGATHPELSGGGDFLNAGGESNSGGRGDSPVTSGGSPDGMSSQALTLVLQPAGANVRLMLYGSVPTRSVQQLPTHYDQLLSSMRILQ